MTKLPFNRKRIGSVITLKQTRPDPNAASPSDGRNTTVNTNWEVSESYADQDDSGNQNAGGSVGTGTLVLGLIVAGLIVYAIID